MNIIAVIIITLIILFLYKVFEDFIVVFQIILILSCLIGLYACISNVFNELENAKNEIYLSIQKQYFENKEYTGLTIYDEGMSSAVVSEADKFNINELKYALTQSKGLVPYSTIKYIYYLPLSEYDEYGQKARDYKCTIEFSNDDIERINFDNISNQDVLKHGEQIPEYDEFFKKKMYEATLESYQACFKLEGES